MKGSKKMSNTARFDIGLNHPLLIPARRAFNECLKIAVRKAITTKSYEGSASLKVSFEISEVMNVETKEIEKVPAFKFKAGYSVPMKDSIEGKVIDRATLQMDDGFGWILVNDQISMDELIGNKEAEE